MPPRDQSTLTPLHVEHATAVELLRTQLEGGVRILNARPLTEADHSRWELITKRNLEKVFGRGAPQIVTVLDAGARSTCPIGASRKWWDAYRLERLSTQLGELDAVLCLLGENPTPGLPRPAPRKAPAERKVAAEPKASGPRLARPVAEARAEPRAAPVAPEAPAGRAAEDRNATTCDDVFEKWGTDAPRSVAASPAKASAPAASVEYFTGVACLNGHGLTGAAEAYPTRATPRCSRCGAGTLRACRECGVGLRGGLYAPRLDDRAEPAWAVPNNCHSCGAAFPWTRLKREALEATIAELEALEGSEREGLLALVPDAIAETPKTAVAVMRWQRALAKLAPETRSLASEVLKQAAVALVLDHLGIAK